MFESVAVIPVYKPDDKLKNTISDLISAGFDRFIVVDDGSGEKYRSFFEGVRAIPGVDVLTHETNTGKGSAIKDAIRYYREQGLDIKYKGIVTVDGDGQHLGKDAAKVAKLMEEKPHDMIIGERTFPYGHSKGSNTIAKFILRMFYGIKLNDTTCGLRGLPNGMHDVALGVKGNRYDFEAQMFLACHGNLVGIVPVPVTWVNGDENAEVQYLPYKDGMKIFFKLLWNFIKFGMSSISAWIFDIILFSIFIGVFKGHFAAYILISTISARAFSATYNFTLNRFLVFKAKGNIGIALIKFFILVACEMLVSAGLVTLLYRFLPVSETAIKVPVDVAIFLLSYRIQKAFIFNDNLGKKRA